MEGRDGRVGGEGGEMGGWEEGERGEQRGDGRVGGREGGREGRDGREGSMRRCTRSYEDGWMYLQENSCHQDMGYTRHSHTPEVGGYSRHLAQYRVVQVLGRFLSQQ